MKRLVYTALKEPIVRFGGNFKLLFNIAVVFEGKLYKFTIR